MSEQHQEFLKRVDNSRPAVFKIAEYLHRSGYSVFIPAYKYAPTASEHMAYVDNGDIIIEGKNNGRVEVKHMKKNMFTYHKDFPFKRAIVASKKSIDRASPTPLAYIFVNSVMTHIGIIHWNTKPHWFVENLLMPNTGNFEEMYLCPLEHVIFSKLKGTA